MNQRQKWIRKKTGGQGISSSGETTQSQWNDDDEETKNWLNKENYRENETITGLKNQGSKQRGTK